MLNAVDAFMSAWASAFHTGWCTFTKVDRAVLSGPVSVAEAFIVYYGSVLNTCANTVKGGWSITSLITSMVAWAGVETTVGLSIVHVTDTFAVVVAVSMFLAVETVEDSWAITGRAGDIALPTIVPTTRFSIPVIFAGTEAGIGITESVLNAFIAFSWL